MSHLKTTAKRTILVATLLSTVTMSSALVANAQTNSGAQYNYAASLSDIELSDDLAQRRTLDWRKPSLDFTFDLPAANLTDSIELLISGDPQGGINPRAPLTVQFNNDEPVVLNVDGQGFDARVTLDPSKARAARNTIRISYNSEKGAKCIGPQDGGWDINMDASKLAINSRPKRRALHLKEIDDQLSNPGLAPRYVSLIATSENATQLQALAAQGIGLRMKELPNFTTDRNSNGFEVIMARRSELYKYISDDSLVAGNGAAIFIPRGRPAKLVFTGDTDADILDAVTSFAQRKLPAARRSITSLGEIDLQRPLKASIVRLSGTRKLTDIPTASGFSNWRSDDWASGPKSLRFDVTDPAAMTGEILLRLASSKNVSDTSKLSVKLNGESLGVTVLNKRRKSVAFTIKAGALRGKDNVLTLFPEITAADTPNCGGGSGPNFHLGGGSKIILNTDTPSAPTELSRMTATAMPFSDARGAQSYIAMTGNSFDFNASLKVLARLAKTSGEGLTAANYTRSLDLAKAEGKHVLFLGPSNRLPQTLVQDAPRALIDALRGQAFEDENLISSNIDKFASLDADASFKIAAQRLSQSRRIQAGGIAALYPSQTSSAHIVGVITNTPGQAYSQSAERISQPAYWSEIKGGVARWNAESVLTVQAAQSVDGYKFPDLKEPSNGLGVNFDASIFDGVINKTSDAAGQAWSGVKRAATALTSGLASKLASNKSAKGEAIKAETPKLSIPEIKRPKLNDDLVVPIAPKAAPKAATQSWLQTTHSKLRTANGWARSAAEDIRQKASTIDLSRSLKGQKNGAQPIGQKGQNLSNPDASPNLVRRWLRPAALSLAIICLLMALWLITSTVFTRAKRS